MLGFLKKRAKKVDLKAIANQMKNRFWDVELDEEKNRIVVFGKYRNLQKDFYKLYVQFVNDEKVEFKDERGRYVTHIPKTVEIKNMYHVIKDILNVI